MTEIEPKIRVIFLDVGGVLTNRTSIGKSQEPIGSSFYYRDQIDPDCMGRLLTVLTQTEATVVLTSDWRLRDSACVGLLRALTALPQCPRRPRHLFDEHTPEGPSRSEEITMWLRTHPEVTAYVVVDDNFVPGHPLVMTDMSKGIQDEHVAMITALLGVV